MLMTKPSGNCVDVRNVASANRTLKIQQSSELKREHSALSKESRCAAAGKCTVHGSLIAGDTV